MLTLLAAKWRVVSATSRATTKNKNSAECPFSLPSCSNSLY